MTVENGFPLPGERAGVDAPRLKSFHELQQHRVQRILLVSSLYDSFILSEEGHLQETLLSQFLALNVSHFPDIHQEPTRAAALAMLAGEHGFDLVVASLGSEAVELAADLRARGDDTPVMGLAYTALELQRFVASGAGGELDRVFLWQGDVRLLLAMVKMLEDRRNAPLDVGEYGVPVILVIEDSIRFYSSFLPAIYSELFAHLRRLLAEDLNASQRTMRMRARPKVLLCDTFEEAWELFETYEEQVLGLVSDFEFPRAGALDARAGYDLCAAAQERRPEVRLVLQSSAPGNQVLADELRASFLVKGSALLLRGLRAILLERFGFGDFVFRSVGGDVGREVGRAANLVAFREALRTVPAETVAYHASHRHLANWLKVRAEFALSERLSPERVVAAGDPEAQRRFVLQMIDEAREARNRTTIADFDRGRFDPTVTFTRIGEGSLGGKARGIAFANRLFCDAGLFATAGGEGRFGDVRLDVPPTVVLATGVFDEFLEYPRLRDFAIASARDEDIEARCAEAPLPRGPAADLLAFLQRVKHPLAVRSSSLLEDSLSQPFAGVYTTWMLPNNDPDLEVRRQQLEQAIKRVYASTFQSRAKAFLALTPYRLEEEHMAVMVQELVGQRHRDVFYPDFAGVARSWNFYPEPDHAPEEGVAAVALGMGRTVVDGSPCLRFNPHRPRKILGFSSVSDALAGSQREFFALDLDHEAQRRGVVDMRRFPLDLADEPTSDGHPGPLGWLGSTWSAADNVVVDGIARDGVRLVSFAHVLKHDAFPLAAILRTLLARCVAGMGGPVELEFAGELPRPAAAGLRARPGRFALLQMRPLALAKEGEAVTIGAVDPERVLVRSRMVLGNVALDDLVDVVVVDRERFERAKSPETALDVARFDAALRAQGRGYLLIGVGRWGSADPHLGIPVGWSQITGARVIVEAGLKDLRVLPSQGTHFFQNLTSCNVCYLTVNPEHGEGELDWSWLTAQAALAERGCVRHLRLERPLEIRVSGRTGEGVVLKPAR
jgi:hypothetical protein